MSRSVTRPQPEEPRLTRMPHLSAPVDEHRLIPVPPRPWWDRMVIRAGVLLGVLALLGYFFVHASALR